MDRFDLKIIECLKTGTKNQTELILYSFVREGQEAWKNRLKRLQDKKIIKVEHLRSGKEVAISLTDKFKYSKTL